MKEQEEKRLKIGGGIAAVVIISMIIISAVVINNANVARAQAAAERASHLIGGSDARVYRYNSNSTWDTYYVVYQQDQVWNGNNQVIYGIPMNGTGGHFGSQNFVKITLSNATLASKVNLTVAQLTCANGTFRIIWGRMSVYPGMFGMFLNVNGSWYANMIGDELQAGICIAYALKHL